MRNLTVEDFAVMWPNANHTLIAGLVTAQDAVYARFGINKALRLVHAWAQFTEETGGGVEMTESLNYSPQGLMSTFPSHFSAEQAHQYGRTPEHPAEQRMIGNLAYGNRMGNHPNTDDGYNFRGRGLIQTTGRIGYTDLAHLTGLDLANHPDLANDPTHALLCGFAEFVNYPGMLDYCDADNLLAVSSLINVGHVVTDPNAVNGYAERKASLIKWKTHLGI